MLEYEPIEPTETERIWEYEADIGGKIWTYQIKWVERTGAHYLTLWNAAGELILAGQRLALDIAPFYKWVESAAFPDDMLVLIDLDNSGAPPQFEELGHRLRLMTYAEADFPGASAEPLLWDIVQVV